MPRLAEKTDHAERYDCPSLGRFEKVQPTAGCVATIRAVAGSADPVYFAAKEESP
jgi:hypothetical protein